MTCTHTATRQFCPCVGFDGRCHECPDPSALPECLVRLGYVVLTDQPDGSWQPDWDGRLHTSFEAGLAAAQDAASRIGTDGVRLAEVRGMEW